jgi:predicted nuclease of restriction endonuclease-like (RecB) superfamily
MTKDASKIKTKKLVAKSPRTKGGNAPSDYVEVLAGVKQLIADSRHRALATVNRELVCLYWQIGYVIVQQQEKANWGDAVVEQLATDLRLEFPDMKGLSRDNMFRMRQFFLSCRDLDRWFAATFADERNVGSAPRQIGASAAERPEVATAPRQLPGAADAHSQKVATLSRQLANAELERLISSLSWSHHKEIIGAVSDPAERYFYVAMSARERWSVRELRRQIDSGLYLRYMSVRRDPEKCLPADAEQGDQLPFKDHYVLEFLGLSDEHTERELRKAILANLRDFFLEFGRDLTFVGAEYPLTIGNDTFYIDLLFFNRRLQCLLSVELKIGKFKPEYVGKSQFYCAALDEQVKLAHENPSIGLVLCKTADSAQVRLALTRPTNHLFSSSLPAPARLALISTRITWSATQHRWIR